MVEVAGKVSWLQDDLCLWYVASLHTLGRLVSQHPHTQPFATTFCLLLTNHSYEMQSVMPYLHESEDK